MYQDHDGRFADFHAPRHTYISQIVAGGSSVKVAQELARHSTSRLTIDRYAHAQLYDVTAALNALHAETVDAPLPEVLAATGTDDSRVGAQHQAQQSDRETGRVAATGCDGRTEPSAQRESPKTLPMADLGEKQRVKRKRRRPDSNRGWRICKTESQAENAGDYAHSADSAAPGAAVDPANAPTDPDLRLIVERWDDLPEPFKAGILAMVRAAEVPVMGHY